MGDSIRLRAIGDLGGLPDFAQKGRRRTIEKTRENNKWNLTLAPNYGSRQEVPRAIQAFASGQPFPERPILIGWKTFSSYLQTKDLPDPDLIIRTSGEFRLSNFLLMQAAYAEIFVSPLHWPDFGQDAFVDALKDYTVGNAGLEKPAINSPSSPEPSFPASS